MTNVHEDSTGLPRVTLNGAQPPQNMLERLLDLRVELPLNAPAQVTMRFFDENFELCDDTKIDIAVKVDIDFPDGTGKTLKVFSGEIVAIATEQGPDGLPELLLTCYDKAHRLSRTTEARTALKQTYADVVRKMASRNGLGADVQGLPATVYEYQLQSVDDAAALAEIARRTGAQWKVADEKLRVFKPPLKSSPTVTVTYGEDLIRFRTRFSPAERNDSVTVRGWDPKSKAEIVGTSQENPTYLSTAPMATSGRTKVHGFGSAKRLTGNTVVLSRSEADEVAESYRSRSSSVEVSARGETVGNPKIVPGEMIAVAGVGTRLAGNYYVTAVEHVFTLRGYLTRFTAGSLTPSSLADLAGVAPTASSNGPVIGIVTNVGDPDNLGRVKVKFPWLDAQIESDWARIAAPGAGASRGLMLLPSVNDEVLVVFEQGDTRRPYVLGGLWNGLDKPPMTASQAQKGGKAIRWGITTAGGDTLTFIDEPGKERLEVVLRDNVTKLVLGKERVELIANQKDLEVKSGQASVLLSKGKDVEIKAMNVTIQAQQNLKLSGLKIEQAAQSELKLSAQATASMTANAKVEISSSGIAELKGAMVKVN